MRILGKGRSGPAAAVLLNIVSLELNGVRWKTYLKTAVPDCERAPQWEEEVQGVQQKDTVARESRIGLGCALLVRVHHILSGLL